VLSIGKLTGAREGYYLQCLAAGEDEYYLHPGERPGYWLGSAAPTLGLEGTVEPEAFRLVLAGCDPRTGGPLVPRAGDPRRVTGFDLTLSAPKSVSVAWALGDPGMAQVIARAHDQAVADTIAVFETEVLRARRGHGGLTQVATDGAVAAAFAHRTSRAGDPQLHTHVVVANVTVDRGGHWSAPDGRRVYGWAKTLGYLYQASLRHHLTGSLGVRWGPVAKGIGDLAGVDPALLAGFSQRRAQITAELERVGFDSPAAARAAALATRPAKEPAPTLETLRGQWAQRAVTLEAELPDMAAVVGRAAPTRPDIPALVDELVSPEGLTRNRSSFDRRDILQGVAAAHRHGAPLDDLRGLADRVLADVSVVGLAVDTPVGGPRFSTAELLAVEARIVDSAARRGGRQFGVVPVTTLGHALAERPSLSVEQRAMVARLTRSGIPVEVVVGRAGAGKTFALDAARSAWQGDGRRVLGAALAARAAAELESGAGIPATTIDRLLLDLERPGPESALPPGSVIVIDEAGMVGSRKLARILAVAERDRAKVVLVGDPRQLPEIEAGGAFAALAARDDVIELVENRRQSQAWERDALNELRSGSVVKAVAAYHAHGRIHLAATADAARDDLVGDWWAARQGGADAAMYALRRRDVDDLNDRARRHMAAAGLLGEETISAAGRELATGDRIVCLRNHRRLGVRNGTTATITAVDTDTGTITIGVGGETRVLPEKYLKAGHVTHGYAMTVHKSQGANVDLGFLLGLAALYREAGYTGGSRSRHGTHIYLVDPGRSPRHPGQQVPLSPIMDLARRLNESRAQQLALDHLRQPDRQRDTGLGL
jgi:conjugative relaxase-like TrwC/TraI family protein